jgi:hypothetical protein
MTEQVKNTEIENKAPVVERPKKPTAKEMKWEADRDLEKVKGIFKNHESPGEAMKFWFRGHPGQEIEMVTLRDGVIEEITVCLMRHLRKNLWYPVDQYSIDKETGQPTTEVGKKVRRCSFYPMSYADYEDMEEVGVPMIPTR